MTFLSKISSSAWRRSRNGRSTSGSPRKRQSKKNTETGSVSRRPASSALRPRRRMVVWNGCGRPSARSAIASPSRISSADAALRAASTTSGTAAVTSFRVRVKTRISSPALCTWTLAPSSFHSNAASPRAAIAASGLAAGCASIGRIGRIGRMAKRSSPACPWVSAARAAGARPPPIMAARRTSAAGTPLAEASASSITPSRAPWRSSPTIRRTRKFCSSAVALPNSASSNSARWLADPLPLVIFSCSNTESTSRKVSVGEAAASPGLSVR